MLISMNWIRDFVDLSGQDIEALIHRFTLSTAEVEDIFHKGSDISGVVVGRILEVNDHPDSKKLHLLKVDVGNEVLDIVCGAPNVAVGLTVPVATVGGNVGELAIQPAKIAGYTSYGMCCSEAELGISADHAGLMELDSGLLPGTNIKEVFPIDDIVFEVDNKSLTNRPDLWSHYGIAREFAALTGRALQPVELFDTTPYDSLPPVKIDVQDTELTYRYSGMKVENVTKKVSPVVMRIRLFYCGMRAINLLADLTNYLMLELGQPMHAFDSKIVPQIEVKRFEKPFAFTTLDSAEREVDENTLMICSNGTPVAIAGVMGGLDSEITDATDSLLLESANFDGVSVRKTSTRLGLRTDASMRYEKMIDPEMTVPAIQRFLKLLLDIDSGVKIISCLSDSYVKRYPTISIDFTKAYVDRYTGIAISNDRILETLSSLGFQASCDNDNFNVVVPSWRATKDVTIKADIIEEITRIYGYDNFEITTTTSPLHPVRELVIKSDEAAAKNLLVNKYGLHEAHSYLWCNAENYKAIGIDIEPNVRLLNSMTPGSEILRNCMTPSLLTFVNENKSFAPAYGIFEIGRAVEGLKDDGMCNERKKLSIVLFSRTQDEKALFLSLRDMLATLGSNIKHTALEFTNTEPQHVWQHPVNTVSVRCGGTTLGFLCTLHPKQQRAIDKKAAIVCAELDMGLFAEIAKANLVYDVPSKFPGIDFDLTFVIHPGVRYAQIQKQIDALGCETLKSVSLTDTFQGDDGSQSLTIRLYFSSAESTLKREDIQPVVDQLVAALEKDGIPLKA